MDDLRLHGLLGGASSEKNFLMKYDGLSDIIKDLKGSPVNVSIGDYVYNEFNYTKLLGAESLVTFDRTTPVQVVGSAYDTSGNGGRKLVRLDNGHLYSVDRPSTGVDYYLRKSTDNGATWSLVYTMTTNSGYDSKDISIATNGNIVYILIKFYTGSSYNVRSFKYDGTAGSYLADIDTAQTALGSTSVTVDSNGHLHAAWSSKNSTYPNSFNIRYSKSTDGGVTWASPTQITTYNTSGADASNPTIVINSLGHPVIIWAYNQGTSTNQIQGKYYNGSSWTFMYPFPSNGYVQSNPSATVDSNGVIHVAWHGSDNVDVAIQHIRYSKSIDNGVTWSSMEKLTSGAYSQESPSISTDKLNKVFILFHGKKATSTTYNNIRLIEGVSGAWGAIQEITNQTSQNILYASTCNNYNNFEKPLAIWKDLQASNVKFYGKWTEDLTPVQIIPPMSLATSKTELQALYADTLKMHNPKTDARYQGFISKKDLWTTALQDFDWVAGSLGKDKNVFGQIGTYEGYAKGVGNLATINTSQGRLTVSGLTFQPSIVIAYTIVPNLSFSCMSFDSTYSKTTFLYNTAVQNATLSLNSNGFVLDFLMGGTGGLSNVYWIAIK